MIDIQQVPDPPIADLRRAGKIRVALYPPQYSKDPVTGELRGWTIELARALAARLSVALATPTVAVWWQKSREGGIFRL